MVGNPSVSLSVTLNKNEKVEHHIRIRTRKFIVLRFWVGSDANPLYGLNLGLIGVFLHS